MGGVKEGGKEGMWNVMRRGIRYRDGDDIR